jgi:hypothetical protein
LNFAAGAFPGARSRFENRSNNAQSGSRFENRSYEVLLDEP